MRILYQFFVFIYFFGIHIVALWDEKAMKWVNSRRNTQPPNLKSSIWIHCASLGEYEMAIPIIQQLKKYFPERKLVLSLFSPSGYKQVKNDQLVDELCFIPKDFRKDVRRFINTINCGC